MKDVSPCKQEACAIQACLRLNNFSDAKCTAEILDLYNCCQRFYARNGTEATNKCCPKPELLSLKMEQANQSGLGDSIAADRGE